MFFKGSSSYNTHICITKLKFMIKLELIVSCLALTGILVACNQSGNTVNSLGKDSVSTSASMPPQIKDNITEAVYTHYIHLKDALVVSNPTEAQAAAKQLAAALAKIDGCENTATLATKISNTTDINVQRFNFTALSSDIIAMLKHTELTSGRMFVQYCPMANNGNGAYWLASEPEIRNPYYGDEMMNCGEVKETIGNR